MRSNYYRKIKPSSGKHGRKKNKKRTTNRDERTRERTYYSWHVLGQHAWAVRKTWNRHETDKKNKQPNNRSGDERTRAGQTIFGQRCQEDSIFSPWQNSFFFRPRHALIDTTLLPGVLIVGLIVRNTRPYNAAHARQRTSISLACLLARHVSGQRTSISLAWHVSGHLCPGHVFGAVLAQFETKK